MALFFTFEVWACETSEPYTDVAQIGKITIPVLEMTNDGNVANVSNVSIESALTNIALRTSDTDQLGNGYGYREGSGLGNVLANLQSIGSNLQVFSNIFTNYTSYKLKIKNSSGYYAVSSAKIDYLGAKPRYLYDNNGNYMGDAESIGNGGAGMPFTSNNAFYNMAAIIVDDRVSTKFANIRVTGSFTSGVVSVYHSSVSTNSTYLSWWGALEEGVSTNDPYADLEGETEITGGGTGTIGIPGFPPISATSTGILGLFSPTPTQMQQLSDYMWTDFGGTGSTEVDVLKEIVQALKRSIANPLDYVVGLSIVPSQGLNIGASQIIKFGFTSSGVSMPRLSSQYFIVDCGSIDFNVLCGNTFLDYAPYSKFSIYLPYIGCKTLDANDCVGHNIGVVYHGDVVTGGVTAYVTKDGSVMYQYSGCCSLNIPLSADSWGATISGAVQIATSMITGAASSGSAGVVQGAISGAANVASNPSLLSPQVQHSGAISGGAGCMGVQYPYIIREAVRFHSTDGFNREHGYPSFYYRKLSKMSGYTVCYDVHVEGINATADEISEIEKLLKSGVIL